MSVTTSLSFPKMFNIAANKVATLEDNTSIVNRTRLLLLTDPTELYNSPEFGVGLRRYLFTYNNENTKAIIQNRIIEQLRKYEPYVKPDSTQFTDGLLFTGDENNNITQEYNQLKMTIGLATTCGDTVTIDSSQLFERKLEEV
jgi:phage baseplate assembly protein W